MSKNYITDGFYTKDDSSHFKGLIWLSDFDTVHAGSRNIAQRIESDYAFDRYCQRNCEAIRLNSNYRNK